MATKLSKSSSTEPKKISTPSGEKSVNELKSLFNESDKLKEVFAATKTALQLLDLSKTDTRTFNSYNKDSLRRYLKNPKSYESNLRNLSKFLDRLCYAYHRLLQYRAGMVDLTACSIIPLINITEELDEEGVLNNYYTTASKIEQMALATEIYKMIMVAWREDGAFGYIYDDDTSGGFFIHVLDGDYCKISSIDNGVFRFAFDFSYFRSNKTDLEMWDSEFKKKFEAYENDSNLRWQELDYERQICLKINDDDPKMCYPPFASLFESIIDLIDLQSIQSVKEELSIYKLLVARLKPLTGAKTADNFEVDVDTAIEYYNRLASELPDCVSSVLSPIPIEPIEFKGNTTEDVDMISNSMSNLFKNAGGSQILDNDKSGATLFTAQILADTQMALKPILMQIQKWTNEYLKIKIGDDHAYIKYMDVSPFTKESKKDSLLKSAQNGIPVKLAIGALDGFSPLQTLSMLCLENDVLKLQDKLIPLSTSYTMSGSTPADGTDPVDGGRPKSDDTDLTDEGAETREEDKNDV